MQDVMSKIGKFFQPSSTSSSIVEPHDETLRSCQSQMLALKEQILSVRTQLVQYADAAMRSCESSKLLSRSMTVFLRDDGPIPAKTYLEGQDSVTNQVVSIFHEAIDGSPPIGIIAQMDEWIDVTTKICVEIEQAERLRQTAETAHRQLQAAQARKTTGRRTSLFDDEKRETGNTTQLQTDIAERQESWKLWTLEFESARDEVLDHVHTVMETRDEIFKGIFIQILKCQTSFYRETSGLLQQYEPVIEAYDAEKSFKPRPSLTSLFDRSLADLNMASAGSPPSEKPPPPPPKKEFVVNDDVEIPKDLPGLPPEPKAKSEEPALKTDDLLGLDFGISFPSSVPVAKSSEPYVHIDSNSSNNNAAASTDPSSDWLGDFFDLMPNPQPQSSDGNSGGGEDLIFPTEPDFESPSPDLRPMPSPTRDPLPTAPTENEKEAAQEEISSRLHEWEFSGGRRRNIRSLLAELHSIAPARAKWKPVTMGNLFRDEQLSKAYKKAIAKFHTDKISAARGFDLKDIVLAEGIFIALTDAHRVYREAQG